MRVKVPLPDSVGSSSLESVLFPPILIARSLENFYLHVWRLLGLSTWCLRESILIQSVTVYMVFMR